MTNLTPMMPPTGRSVEPSQSCPLCGGQQLVLCHTHQRAPIANRQFWHCQTCDLIHVPSTQHWSPEAERELYDQHQNDPHDVGYRNFLNQLVKPLLHQLHAHGKTPISQLHALDFGCGPAPTVSKMLAAHGLCTADYDLYYAHKPQLLEAHYQVITSTEVFEHLSAPAAVIDQLLSCLTPAGLLAIMTKPWHDIAQFKTWHYINDPTHIVFYHRKTLAWIARQFSLKLLYQQQSVTIWQRQ